jgi:hypothetical protein
MFELCNNKSTNLIYRAGTCFNKKFRANSLAPNLLYLYLQKHSNVEL